MDMLAVHIAADKSVVAAIPHRAFHDSNSVLHSHMNDGVDILSIFLSYRFIPFAQRGKGTSTVYIFCWIAKQSRPWPACTGW